MSVPGGERRAYSRGYNAGSIGRWPSHRPPRPPDEVVGPIIDAAQELRDAVDAELATFLDEDEIVERFGPLVDAYDEAVGRIGTWLRSPGPPAQEDATK